jgi:hypothetical protein
VNQDNALQNPIYGRLDESKKEIRLLRINPSNDENRMIECKITTVALEEAEPYAALSYVWGDPKATATIVINNHQVNVTTNLEGFLRQYRSYHRTWSGEEPSLLWVDAICINQHDIPERNS